MFPKPAGGRAGLGKRGLCRAVGAAHPLSGSSRGSGRDERGTHDLRKAIPGSRLRQPGVRERSPAPGKPRKEGWKGPAAPSGQAAEATATFIRPGQLPLAGENKTDVQRHPREMGRTIRGRTQKRGHDSAPSVPRGAWRRAPPRLSLPGSCFPRASSSGAGGPDAPPAAGHRNLPLSAQT